MQSSFSDIRMTPADKVMATTARMEAVNKNVENNVVAPKPELYLSGLVVSIVNEISD